jgi:hypothetical protein
MGLIENEANRPKIQLFQYSADEGIMMCEKEYQKIADFIFSAIQSKISGKIDLTELIEEAGNKLSCPFNGATPYFLLKVKEDLQARRIIKVKVSKKPLRQYIMMNANPPFWSKQTLSATMT